MEVDQNDEVTSMDCIDTTSPETKQCFCPIKANSVSEHTALTANDQLLKGTTTEHVDITGKEMGQYDESTYSTLTTANDELLQASEGSDKAIDGQPLDDVNFSTGILQCTEATTKMDATEIDVDPNEQAISPATTDNDGSVGTLRELELNKGNSIAEDGIVSLNDKEHGELVLTGNVDVTILEIEEQEHFKEVVDIFQHTEETTKMDTTEMNMDHNEEAISPAVRTAANDESVEMQRDLDLNKDNRTVEGRNVTLNIKQHTEPALTCNTDMTRLELKEQEHFNEVTDVLVNASKDDTLKSLEEGNPGSVQDGEIITADIQANEKLSRGNTV